MLIKEALAPLLLRLALAAIFIYHGLIKITPTDKNDWGAMWATNLWERLGRIPEEVTKRLDKIESASERIARRMEIENLYREEGKRELPPVILGYAAQLAVAWGELLGGVSMLLGLWTRLSALGLLIIQIAAIATVTWFKGFSPEAGGGYEFNLVLAATCLALIFMGGGSLSIDHCFASRRQQKALTTQPPVTSPATSGV